MMRRQISERLGCKEDDLDQRGMIVVSAGIAAMAGCGPSSEAVEVMQEKGIDLQGHESQPLTDKLVRHADLIFTMTASHRQAMLRRWPNAASRTFPLCTNEGDIADPIGGTTDVYRQCADQIHHALQLRVAELDIS
jgi:protein-tyrosine-phosphatase